jgi:RNA polymerase sigma factor (TIGR02999 family)
MPEMWDATDDAIQSAVSVLRSAPLDATQAIEDIYHDLRGLARARMSRERPGHTLRPTALVNEVYVVISKKYGDQFWFQDRAQILATFSAVMRHFLWDYHKAKIRQKRPGSACRVESEVLERLSIPPDAEQLIVSDLTERGLRALRECSARRYQVVELRLSLNLKEHEIASLLGVHVNTVKEEWRQAKDFLRCYFMQEGLTGRPDEVEGMLACFGRLFG